MGFSTSGAVVVILIGFLVAISVFVPTLFSVGAETGGAFSTQSEQFRDQANTNIEIESFEMELDEEGDVRENPTINVTNTGSSALSVDSTDLVVVGEYYPTRSSDSGGDYSTTIVLEGEDREERDTSDAWVPGSHLEIELTEYGVDEYGITDHIVPDDEELDENESPLPYFEDGDRIRVTTERGISDAEALTVIYESAEGDE